MKKTAVVGLGAVAAATIAFAAKDPVIMTVGGRDVPRSEFEYLYNKNSQQQVNPQTLEDYVDLFALYKMKVEDARAEGIDTMAAFRKEMETYRHDLAAPYLADSVFLNSLVREAWERSKQETEARHIMLFKTREPAQNAELRHKADSLLGVLKGGADFAQIAKEYSQDRGSKDKGGLMGWIVSGNYPYSFEEVAFSLPKGELSGVVESPMGYHILKGGAKRAARGKVQVQHILKLTQNKSEADQKKAKEDIDSLYNVVSANPLFFPEVAKQNSQDPGSARQGGLLPFFGAGEMVAEFDSVAFSLADGEISKPFKTSYGYHIVRRLKTQPVASESQIKAKVLAQISRPEDARNKLVRKHQNNMLAKRVKGKFDEKVFASLKSKALENGITPEFMAICNATTAPLFSVGSEKHYASEITSEFGTVAIPSGADAANLFEDFVDLAYNKALVEAAEDLLLRTEPDYRNLLKEYVDGSMLYEVSNRKVWDRAAKDTEGLNAFFNAHKSNYKWSQPRAKGFLVQAANDSIGALIRERAASLDEGDIIKTIRDEFKGKSAIDKVLVAQGTNAMVDNIVFGGPAVTPQNAKYEVYFMLNPRVISEPEDVADVKGLVTSDYQTESQAAWEKELRKKYPVVVNEKVLKTVKQTGSKK